MRPEAIRFANGRNGERLLVSTRCTKNPVRPNPRNSRDASRGEGASTPTCARDREELTCEGCLVGRCWVRSYCRFLWHQAVVVMMTTRSPPQALRGRREAVDPRDPRAHRGRQDRRDRRVRLAPPARQDRRGRVALRAARDQVDRAALQARADQQEQRDLREAEARPEAPARVDQRASVAPQALVDRPAPVGQRARAEQAEELHRYCLARVAGLLSRSRPMTRPWW